MTVEDLATSVSAIIVSSLSGLAVFIPQLIGGLVVLIIGLVVALIVHRAVLTILKAVRLEEFLKRYGLGRLDGTKVTWSTVLAELARWSVIVIFLIPTLQVWGLGATNIILNQILSYIPHVIVAVIIGLLGLVFANLGHDVTLSAAQSLGRHTANTMALVARWAIIVFTALIVLNQLGIAADLIRILFTGLVAMLALAGGIAFGWGGSDSAKELLKGLRDRFKQA